MIRTVQNVIQTVLLHSGASANLWEECLYAVFSELNYVTWAGRPCTEEEELTRLKPYAAHIRIFWCKIWVVAANKTERTLEANVRWANILRTLLYGRYQAMMKSDRIMPTSWYCAEDKSVIPMKRCNSEVRVYKDGSDDSLFHEDEYFDFDGLEHEIKP